MKWDLKALSSDMALVFFYLEGRKQEINPKGGGNSLHELILIEQHSEVLSQ